jgi:hypothetical protein
MMRHVLLLCLAPGFAFAAATPVSPPNLSAPDAWVAGKGGTLLVLNKVDTRVTEITLAVGETRNVEQIAVTLAGCFVRPVDLPQDSAAHVRIASPREGAAPYDGWLLAHEPGMGVYEDPIFDVRVKTCLDK